MLVDTLQDQGIGIPLITVDRKQQTVAAIQPRAIKIVAHLLDLRREEIVCLQISLHLLEPRNPAGFDLVIKQNSHTSTRLLLSKLILIRKLSESRSHFTTVWLRKTYRAHHKRTRFS